MNKHLPMFRKFTLEDISTQNQVKSSIQRGIRGALLGFFYLPDPLVSRRPLRSIHMRIQKHPKSIGENACAAKICTSYPILEESGAIEQILPKKEQALLAKL